MVSGERLDMEINSIMTKEVVSVSMDHTLKTVYEIFEKNRFHHLIVIEEDELRGVISDRDLLRALSPFLNTLAEQDRDLSILKKKAHQIMSRNPVTIDKEASLEEAVEVLLQKNISCLPVLSSDGRIEGIVTWKDLLKAYSRPAQEIC